MARVRAVGVGDEGADAALRFPKADTRRRLDKESRLEILARTLKERINRGGLWAAAGYALIVVLVFALTAATTKPSNVGLDWIPFILLAMPWYAINAGLLLPGLIVNTILMYALGSALRGLYGRLGGR